VAKVYAIESPQLERYTADAYVAALKQFIASRQPKLVLMPHTYQVRDFAPKLAAALGRTLISDAVGYRKDGTKLFFTRQMFQGKFAADVSFSCDPPHFATFQAGSYRGDKVEMGADAAPIEKVAAQVDGNTIRVKPLDIFKEAKQAVDLTQEQFGSLPRGNITAAGPIPVAHPHALYRRKRELEQTHICLGTPAYPYAHEKRFASYVLNTILGGGMSSRLFQNIREKYGLVYAVFSGLSAYRDAGILSIYAGTAPGNARKVVSLIIAEFRNLKNTSIPADELQRAKDYLKGNLLLGLESTTSRMANIARQELYYGQCITLDEVSARIDAVTREDVAEVARELFQSDRIALTVLGPRRGFNLRRNQLEC